MNLSDYPKRNHNRSWLIGWYKVETKGDTRKAVALAEAYIKENRLDNAR